METLRRQRCGTCEFHEPGESGCTGTCANPTWQPMTGVRLLVRDKELACYQGWGIHYWKERMPEPHGISNNGTTPMGPGNGGFPLTIRSLVIPLRPVEDVEG